MDQRAKRLLLNTYLDLVSCTTYRHWPAENLDFNCTSVGQPRDFMKVAIDRRAVVINALTKRCPTSFPISVGQDCRPLLVFASGCLDQVDRFYTHVTNFYITRDDEIAQTLCELMGVEKYRPYSFG